MMSHEAISIALHADSSSIEPRRIAKSSNMIWPVWRMLKTLRPITCGAIARTHSAMTFSLPAVTYPSPQP
jgi:hypothetical protein